MPLAAILFALNLGELSQVEFFKLFPESSYPEARLLRISTAVRMNATFPFVSPAVSLPTEGPRRVVDAGFVDNYGILVASDWIYKNREWLAAKTSGVVMIQIHTYARVDPGPAGGLADAHHTGFDPWSTALEVYAAAKRRAMMERDEERIHRVERWFHSAPKRPRFQSVVLECPSIAALSWVMTTEDYDSMRFIPYAYEALKTLFPDPHKKPRKSAWMDRLENVFETRIRTQAGYARAAQDYLRKLSHIWSIFNYHAHDPSWADDLNPEMRKDIGKSLEELRIPEDEVRNLLERF